MVRIEEVFCAKHGNLSERQSFVKEFCKASMKDFVVAVGKATELSLGIITHLIVGRLISGQNPTTMFETTLEMLQFISIRLPCPASSKNLFNGDKHSFQLYCN